MFEVNCPYCKSSSISDVCDKLEDSDGVWECANGHQFELKFLGYFPLTPEDIKYYMEHGGKIVKCPICKNETDFEFKGCPHTAEDLAEKLNWVLEFCEQASAETWGINSEKITKKIEEKS